MEQAIANKTIMAENYGSQVYNWRTHLLFPCLICFFSILNSCQEKNEFTIEWISIENGTCSFGANNGISEESPEVSVPIHSFEIAATEVTNQQFSVFVEATNYITDAEKNDGSIFYDENGWQISNDWNWRHPQGKGSDYKSLLDHPVVCISYNDSKAFCKWAKVRLPSEIEWEFACEQGKTTEKALNVDEVDATNENALDQFKFTSPVKTFPPNKLGMFDMLGNIWEMCDDDYEPTIHSLLKNQSTQLTQIPYLGKSSSPKNPSSMIKIKKSVIKGGSFLCHKSYCYGYRSDARQSSPRNESYFHIGFRVARDLK